MKTKKIYYPHIDGLRAIAILAVLLFHVGIPGLTAGYLGVDIFFVISGFLITSHLSQAIDDGNFSFKSFYLNRVRRLYPALAFTVLVTTIVGVFILSPPNLEQLATQSLAATLSFSNILFWLESGYFDSDSSLKPLLHTWSLAVEEQFYLIWPLVILLTIKVGKWLLPLLALISLIAAEYYLGQSTSTVFFLMPFRIFEFCMGSFAYFLMTYRVGRLFDELQALVGCFLLIIPLFVYDKTTIFPGASALPTCLGAMLLIHSKNTTLVNRFLSIKPLLWIGSISYSLYLCHWPLIVFYKSITFEQFEWIDQLLIIFFSIVLAYLMYRFVETPFRVRDNLSFKVSNKKLVYTVLSALFFIFSLAGVIHLFSGKILPNTKYLTQSDIQQGMDKRLNTLHKICVERDKNDCYQPSSLREKNILVLGDSHALDGFNALVEAFPSYHHVLKGLPGGCPPFVVDQDENLLSPNHPSRQDCLDFNQMVLTEEALKPYSTVVISVYFNWYRAEHLIRAIERIHAVSSAKVIVFGNYIVLNRDFPEFYNKQIDPLSDSKFIESFALDEDKLKAAAHQINFHYLSKRELLCEEHPLSECPVFFKGEPYTYDRHHLSLGTSRVLGEAIAHKYPRLLEK